MRSMNANVALATALLWLAVGCGGAKEESAEATSGPKKFQIFPPTLFGGFDGANMYKVPISIFKSDGPVTISVDDPSLVSIDAQSNGTKVMLTTLKAGKTMLHAKTATQSADAPLTINMYTPKQHDAGMNRYMMAADMMNPACQDCHGKGNGPDHTPTEVDADPDDDIANTFLTGTDPEGRPVDAEHEFTRILKDYKHMWKVTDEEKVGLVAYLRSLPPTGYPPYDGPTAGEEEE